MSKILVVDDDRVTRHLVRKVLTGAGFSTSIAKDGVEALKALGTQRFDLLLLDVWMPRMTGLDVLATLRNSKTRPRVVVMTSDDTPETLLTAVRDQAFMYVHKPVAPATLLETVRGALQAPEPAPIEVVSGRPDWVELVVPCTREAAERIHTVMAQLGTKLDPKLRDEIAYAFRELLTNAIEWGGKLDPNRTVRIACVRTPRMLLYRIADPGEGFDIDKLLHAAIMNPDDDPMHHLSVREAQGLRPGGFGLAMTLSLVDDLIYNEARNEVLLIKYLDDGGDK